MSSANNFSGFAQRTVKNVKHIKKQSFCYETELIWTLKNIFELTYSFNKVGDRFTVHKGPSSKSFLSTLMGFTLFLTSISSKKYLTVYFQIYAHGYSF